MKDRPVIPEIPGQRNSAGARLTRRSLLAGGATSGVLGAAGGFWSALSADEKPSPPAKLRLGFVGVGGFGVNNLAALTDEEITGLCDVDENALGEMGQQFPRARRFTDWRKMLAELPLDGVVISTPDHQHAGIALAAMERGLHVYCEKPLAHSIAEGRRMAAAAKRQRVVTQLGVQHHDSPGYRLVREMIRGGAIGPITEVHGWTARPIWPQGELQRPAERPETPPSLHWDLWLGPAPQRPYHPAYLPQRWRAWWDFGTGSLGDMGPHLFDPAVSALELGAPERVSAQSGPVNAESAPAWCVVHWNFPARAGRGAVKLVYYDGGKRPPADLIGDRKLPPDGVLFVGSKGQLFAPQRGGPPFVFPREPREKIAIPAAMPEGPSHQQNWIAACRARKPAATPFEWGAALCEIPLLGNIALRTGPFTWDAARMTTGNEQADALLHREVRHGWGLPRAQP